MMNRFIDTDCSFKRLTPVYGFRSAELVSIEKALQPIESQIANLPAYIKVAKKYCHYPSEHGLTHDESASIYIYTMEWGEQSLYRVLNKTLRNENRHLCEVWFSYMKLFDTALNKLPTVKDVVWRGITADIGKFFIKNQIITWWSINSCSSSVNVIKRFLGNGKNSTTLLIEALNGKKVSGYTKYESEDEIILTFGTEFRVKSNALDHPNGSYLVHLIEIDDENNDNNHASTLASSINQMQLTTNQISSKPQPTSPGKKVTTTVSTQSMGGKSSKYHINNNGEVSIELSTNGASSKYKAETTIDTTTTMIDASTIETTILTASTTKATTLTASTTILTTPTTKTTILTTWKPKWKQNAITVAGGNGQGQQLNQVDHPLGIFIDKKKNIFIAEFLNHRIVEWKYNAKEGHIIAGGNGQGNRIDQLNYPIDVIVDQRSRSVIISDSGNRRVIQWLNQNQQILIDNIDCSRLATDNYEFLYVSDSMNNEVKRWKMGEYNNEGTVVAGGNGQGNQLNQLNHPTFIFVDEEQSVYVSNENNYRVLKWRKDAQEGIVVAGGNGQGENLNQLSRPQGIAVNYLGEIYVADFGNHRVMRWCEGKDEGEIVVGGNGQGNESNQLNYPTGLCFDDERNLYVGDHYNHRIQKFEIIL
ncbi:unnamed protein product [Adineta steineri]|uniref:NAD(P)(+)--arginine ADP-ribosyltransferase n=1 Tax=Adineta steineri TaxID=433720 RepID=A0A813V259_9BILA|nr:unnamed protein product [Adineta steineri]CAF3898427.1 unnamed protein product [Adineta steineri]